MPKFDYSLISVSSLLQNEQFSLTFSTTSCIIQDKFKLTTIGKAECLNGIYLLVFPEKSDKCSPTTPVFSDNCHSSLSCNVHIDTWHSRLGHLSHKRLTLLKDTIVLDKHINPCPICPQAK